MKVLRGVDSSLIFFFFLASFCSKVFQEAFNHRRREAYCFCIVSIISSVWTCVSSQISARVSGDCVVLSTDKYSRYGSQNDRSISCVAVESGRPRGGGGLEERNGLPKPAVTNAFQRLADRLANQYNSNGCFCLLYK